MDKVEISTFIDKTISKTKSKDLQWRTITSNDTVKPLPTDKDIDIFSSPNEPIYLSREDSYIATFNTGEILLLVFCPSNSSFLFNPPDDCKLSLRIQDEKSRYAIEISNKLDDPFNATELVRLYNLIDKDSSSVSALIDDFLNS